MPVAHAAGAVAAVHEQAPSPSRTSRSGLPSPLKSPGDSSALKALQPLPIGSPWPVIQPPEPLPRYIRRRPSGWMASTSAGPSPFQSARAVGGPSTSPASSAATTITPARTSRPRVPTLNAPGAGATAGPRVLLPRRRATSRRRSRGPPAAAAAAAAAAGSASWSGRSPSLTVSVFSSPPRVTLTSTESPGLCSSTSEVSVLASSTGLPPSEVMTSPACRPASAAGPSLVSCAICAPAPSLAACAWTPR